jgi:hypothetical protein
MNVDDKKIDTFLPASDGMQEIEGGLLFQMSW